MSLKETLNEAVKIAMKARDMERVSALRMVTAAVKNKEIEVRPNDLTDEDVLGVLKKLCKQRKDSIEQYQNAGRTDLVEKEQKELHVIEEYLPEQMSEDQVKGFVEEAIKETGASSMKDMGKVMQAVLAKTQGAADNKLVSQIVKNILQ
ncbi:MAG: GatB/YqeY domain-containing protein [Bdellovibrionales bacterium]|nr:GatB/YqeY domain-containing protein [Bdellovibrionales bacterium]